MTTVYCAIQLKGRLIKILEIASQIAFTIFTTQKSKATNKSIVREKILNITI